MPDRLLDTIAAVYETIDRRSSWAHALGELCRAVDAHAAMLTLEAPGGHVLDHHQHGFDDGWLADYARDWAARSPYLDRFYDDPSHAGRFVASEDLLSYEDWVATEMFAESGRLQDIHHGVAAYFDTADALRVRLSCVRDRAAGPVERGDLDRLDCLLPHISQALRIGRAFPDPVADRLRVLDDRDTPAIVLGRDLAIVERNAAASALLEDEPRVGRRDGRLCIADREAARRVASAVDACCFDERWQQQVLLDASDEQLPLSLLISRAPRRFCAFGDACPAEHGRSLALLTVVRRDRPQGLSGTQLRECFGLTPAEARLASLIATGRSPDRAAIALGVSVSTVRWHLKRVFAKTGTAGQSELTALLQSLAHAAPTRDRD